MNELVYDQYEELSEWENCAVPLHRYAKLISYDEAAHVWWLLNQTNNLVDMLIDQMHVQSEAVGPDFLEYRNLMKLYRWGDGSWSGMWIGPPYNRWNADEIWAGGASFSMGNTDLYPPQARRMYEMMYRSTEKIFLPFVASGDIK